MRGDPRPGRERFRQPRTTKGGLPRSNARGHAASFSFARRPGASVTTAITGLTLPANSNYGVIVTPNQDAVAYVTSKTTTGFSVVLNPRLAANTLAAGTF